VTVCGLDSSDFMRRYEELEDGYDSFESMQRAHAIRKLDEEFFEWPSEWAEVEKAIRGKIDALSRQFCNYHIDDEQFF